MKWAAIWRGSGVKELTVAPAAIQQGVEALSLTTYEKLNPANRIQANNAKAKGREDSAQKRKYQGLSNKDEDAQCHL